MTDWVSAVETVARRANRSRGEAFERLGGLLRGHTVNDLERLAAGLSSGRLTLNFHPDRIALSGVSVAAGLLADGCYHSQWRTGLSNGSRSAVAGGDRHRWERDLFGDVYDHLPPVEPRPVYGALDLLHDPHGGSPRFGSSYVVLAAPVLGRATLCVGDSHGGPRDVGTITEPLSVLAGLAEQAAAGSLLGQDLALDHLADVLAGRLHRQHPGRVLDGYVESQVHGGVDLATDVEAIVLDPSFRNTRVERDLSDAALRYGFRLDWHGGSELEASAIPDDFRGPSVAALGRRVARPDGTIDAFTIGRAAERIGLRPPTPAGDPSESGLQQFKYLWHTVLAFGHDARDAG